MTNNRCKILKDRNIDREVFEGENIQDLEQVNLKFKSER